MSDHLATLSGPNHAFCCPTTYRRKLYRRPIYKYRDREFCCLPKSRYKYFHRTKHKHLHRVSDLFYTDLHKLTSLTKFLCPFHLTGHQPTFLRTCSHWRCNKFRIHLLCRTPSLHRRCLRLRDRTLLVRVPSCQATALRIVRRLARFKHQIHVSAFSWASLCKLLHFQICIHPSLQCPSKYCLLNLPPHPLRPPLQQSSLLRSCLG